MKPWKRRPRPNLQSRSQNRSARPSGRGGTLRRAGQAGKVMLCAIAFFLGGWSTTVAYWEAGPLLTDLLAIQEISVVGANLISQQEVMERVQLEVSETLLSVSPAQIITRLEAHPLIKEASVTRELPHTLVIRITERRAVAVLQTSTLALLLDGDGRVLSVHPDLPASDLPRVVGIDSNSLVVGEAQATHAAQSAIRLAGFIQESFEGPLVLDMSNPGHGVATIQGLRFHFGLSDIEQQWERYRAVRSLKHVGMGRGRSEIDLRYPGKVIVRQGS